ncbi:FMN-binding protein [Arhodomonas sp. SL1]|uniref:FMN-binding protein n=1 Tax=Arhodomonas sp. SL1 TaxID=3425691 RepID=UPI003F883FEE
MAGSSPPARYGRRGILALALLGLALTVLAGDSWRSHVAELLAEAARTGELSGEPPAAPVFDADGERLGYALLTDHVTRIPGYGGRPFRILVVLDRTGHIAGARIIEHTEPILQAGVSESALERFIAQYEGIGAGTDVRVGGRAPDNGLRLDGISGATITAMSMGAAITESAYQVAASRGLPLAVGRKQGSN